MHLSSSSCTGLMVVVLALSRGMQVRSLHWITCMAVVGMAEEGGNGWRSGGGNGRHMMNGIGVGCCVKRSSSEQDGSSGSGC